MRPFACSLVRARARTSIITIIEYSAIYDVTLNSTLAAKSIGSGDCNSPAIEPGSVCTVVLLKDAAPDDIHTNTHTLNVTARTDTQ